MIEPYTLFREGGLYMYVLFMVALVLPVPLVVVLLARGLRQRVPLAVVLLAVAAPLVLGLLGVRSGLVMVLSAVQHASPEMVHELASAGLVMALYPGLAGAALAALAASLMAVAVGLGTSIGAGPDARVTAIHAVLPALLGVLSLAGLLLGAWLGTAVAVGGAFGIVLASVRFGESEGDAGRSASGRAQAAALGLFGLGCAALTAAAGTLASIQTLHALAPGGMKATLSATAMADALSQAGALGALGFLLAVAGVASVGPVARHLTDGRSLGSGAAALLVLVPVGMALVAVSGPLAEVHALAQDPTVEQLEDLRAAGVSLPTYAGEGKLGFAGSDHRLRVGSSSTFDGSPVVAGSFACPEEGVVVEADARTPLAKIVPFAATCTRVRWALLRDDELEALDVSVVSGGGGEAIEVLPLDDGRWMLVGRSEGLREPLQQVEQPALLLALSQAPTHPTFEIWFPSGATSQDLVDLLTAASAADLDVVWRVDAPPAPPALDLSDEPGDGEPMDTDDTPVALDGASEVMGSLDKASISSVIKRFQNQIRYCYERELAKNGDLAGKVTIDFVVAADGSVAAASVRSSTLNSSPVETCIVGRFKRMQFPEPKGGGVVKVSYPFVFSPE